ncbi:MAG TPA: MFS transporter [Pseudolabrys sp.]
MADTAELRAEPRSSHIRIVALVSAAHFVSHYYILILAPLLPFVRDAYNVSYTEIGLALAAFNVVTAALQTPAGFLVDWLGARIILIIGLLIGAVAFTVVGLVDSFWVMVVMFGLAGVGNTVYHPADYAMLSHHVPSERIGHAFSVHTFAGMMGSTAAPAGLLLMQSMWGWRAAFIGSGLLGLVVALVLILVREGTPIPEAAKPKDDTDKSAGSWSLLLSGPILMNLLFFVLLAMISGGMFNYSVVALGVLHGTPPAVANTALSSLLLTSAFGVLAGGVVATRGKRHAMVAALGLAGMAAMAVLIGQIDLGSVMLIAVMTVFGFFYGVIMPSRDMIVRDVTPPGSFGKVFGFITTGFNIGGIVSPLIFGAVMDHGNPRLVFAAVAAFALLSVLTVITLPRKAA